MRFVPIFLAVALTSIAACSRSTETEAAVQFDANETGPQPLFIAPYTFNTIPKLGTVTILADDASITQYTRSTVDFSVGALDPSAYFLIVDGLPTLVITAYAPEDTDLTGARGMTLKATFPTVGPGGADTIVMKLFDDSDDDVAVISQGAFAAFVTSVTPTDNEAYSRITGTFGGTVCVAQLIAIEQCTAVSGSFDTLAQVQF